MHTPYDQAITELENTIRTLPLGEDSLLREASNSLHDKANQRHGYRLGVSDTAAQRDQLRKAAKLAISCMAMEEEHRFHDAPCWLNQLTIAAAEASDGR